VSPATLDDALALVGRGAVATVVGRLRPEVRAVDVDLTGDVAAFAVDTITDWCRARGLWHLVRASGGADGRAHVLVVPGVHLDALTAFIAELRAEFRIGPRSVDLRRQVRPLSAPHRRRGATPPPSGAGAALVELARTLEALPERITARRRAHRAEVVPLHGPDAALIPRRRPRRQLPEVWAAYLDRGRAAARAVDRDPSTRSQIELEATFQLVIAGYGEDEAWQAVHTSARTAFTKSKRNGRRWWWLLWNRAVLDADTWLAERRAQNAGDPLPATLRARAHLESAWRSWPATTRQTDYEIAAVLIERMEALGDTELRIPQRELLLLCAVGSRTTIRASLPRLVDAGLITVEATYAPGTTDTSDTIRLAERFITEPHDTEGAAVSATGPHRFQPPQPRPPLPQRLSLGLTAAQLLQRLQAGPPSGTTTTDLLRAAGLLTAPDDEPTAGQLRAARAHLRVLAGHGLARGDEHGLWHALPPSGQAEELVQVGSLLTARKARAVAQERREFRDTVDVDRRRERWRRQRDAARQRAAKARRARQHQWWSTLDPDEQRQRQQAAAAAFLRLSPAERAARKHALASDRSRAGEHERTRYDQWLNDTAPEELERRSQERALWFAGLPAHERAQLVMDWNLHRSSWNLPHALRVIEGTPPPQTRRLPEDELLRRPATTVEQQVLFDEPPTRRRPGHAVA